MKKNIKVIVLMGSPYLYGSEKANIDVFKALSEKDIDSLFLTYNKNGEGDKFMHPFLKSKGLSYLPVSYHGIFRKKMKFYEWFQKIGNIIHGSCQLYIIQKRYKPTHIYVSKPEFFLNFLPVLYFIKTPIIYRIGDAPTLHNAVYRNLWKIIISKVHKFICVAHFIEKEVANAGADKKNIDVIYSRPHDRYDNKYQINSIVDKKDDIFNVLYVGQISKHKGVDLFIESALVLCEKYDNINFTLAGKINKNDKFTNQQIEAVRKSAYADRILFLDYVENVDDLYKASDLHICPSIYDEPLANVLIDAKINAVPSIIFNVGGLPEIIKHRINGFICDDRTAESLVSVIQECILDKNFCAKLGKNAYTSLKELKVDKFSERWLNVFKTTI